MQVLQEKSGNLVILDDSTKIESNRPVLSSTVTINKKGSENLGKTAKIINVRANKIIVELKGRGKTKNIRTYDFNNLESN